MNLAPNGKPSKLTPEQYRLVRTSAFKNWFGDWINSPETASKVVDEETKEPLVVWHGSKSSFNEFDLSKSLLFGEQTEEAGFHFGTLSQASSRIKSSKEKYFYECFLNIRNIVEVSDMVFFSKHKISLRLYELGVFTKEDYRNWGKFYDIIKEKKIDGLKYLNKWEGYGNEFSYNVFYPEQIKLADGTNTSFDANNPDIRYKDGGNTTQDYWAGKKSGEWYSKKLRIDQLRIGKEFLLARRNFKIQKSKVDEQQKPVWNWEHRDSVYDEKGMAIGNDWYNNITDDVLLLSDLYNEFIELREEKKKLVNSNKEELEKIGYKDWIYKDYLINKRVEWDMHDSEGVLEGLGSNESIMAIGTKSYCKEIQNNEAKEEYEYYINPSKTQKGLYVLREVWLGYYLKSGGNIDDFTYDIGGL